MRNPRIWVFGGNRRGDDAQVYALAEELALPFETRTLVFNWRFLLSGKYMGASPVSVEKHVRERTLVPPWPDLIILAGKRAVPIALWVQEQSGGHTRLVLVGHPRVSPSHFDLVFTTRQYLTPEGASMRLQPLTMSRYRNPTKPTDEESCWLESLPRPHLLLMLGGETRHWAMRPQFVADYGEKLADRASRTGGSLIVVRSARTTEEVLDSLEGRLERAGCEWRVVRHYFPRFPVLLHDADELFPTADSVSMISESVMTGKPVGIVPAEMNALGRLVLGSKMWRNRARDLRRFWKYVIGHKLAGTVDEPVASSTPNPVVEAAREVRALLEKTVGTLPE
ncbi:MAG: mitochondrial fission ELM1 family protein [Sphingomonas sp.]|nr:mitochondrial fission ELM1 family protein [Sphingomonas sp.]